MLLEIIKVLENLVIFLPIIVMLGIIISFMRKSIKNEMTLAKNIKLLVCTSAVIFFVIVILVFSAVSIAQVATMLNSFENENEVLEPWAREAMYLSAETFVLFTGSMSIVAFWYLFYCRQVIPGNGSVKERIKNYFKDFTVKRKRNERRTERKTEI